MKSITIKEYFAVDGSPFSNKDAQKIGPVLSALSNQGAVTARDVVDAARSANSPLHEYFEWNDKIAADLWRVEGARRMLRSIKIKYVESDNPGPVLESRAFQVERPRGWQPEARQYRTFEVLHGDSAFAAQMMDSAFDDLMRWRQKYSPYVTMWQSFGDTFQQIVNQICEWEEDFPSEQAAVETEAALKRLLEWREESAAVLETWTAAREAVQYIMEAIGEAEKKFAKLNELKHRDCIKCGKSFVSVSIGNHMCKACLNSKTVNEKNINAIDAQIAG